MASSFFKRITLKEAMLCLVDYVSLTDLREDITKSNGKISCIFNKKDSSFEISFTFDEVEETSDSEVNTVEDLFDLGYDDSGVFSGTSKKSLLN